MTKREEIAAICRAELGYIEGKNNRTKYGEDYGAPLGAWCAKFVWWVFDRAGVALPVKTAYCPTLLDRSTKIEKPSVGSLVFYDWNANGKPDHVEIVVEVLPDRFRSIGGNTGNKSDRVAQHTYKCTNKCVLAFTDYISDESDETEQTVNPYRAPNNGNLMKGSKGDGVRWLQFELSALGFYIGKSGVDGIFGSYTRAAVIAFQRNHGLSADGICGKNTRAKIKEVRG